jgi:hypothetical protein
MTWASVPTFSPLEVMTAALMNVIGTDVNLLANTVTMLDSATPLVGSNPALGAPVLKLQPFNATVATNGAGQGTLTFPTSFPNGTFGVILQDTTTITNHNQGLFVDTGTMTNSGCTILVIVDAAPTATTVNFTALGLGF